MQYTQTDIRMSIYLSVYKKNTQKSINEEKIWEKSRMKPPRKTNSQKYEINIKINSRTFIIDARILM